MTADFQNGLIFWNIWCFLERLFAQNYSNVVVESISVCCLELRYLKLRATPSSRSKSAANKRKVLVVLEVFKSSDIHCLLTVFLIFKFPNHRRK